MWIVSPGPARRWAASKVLSGEVGLVPVPPAAAEPFTYQSCAKAEAVSANVVASANAVRADPERATRPHFASVFVLLPPSILNMKLSLVEYLLIRCLLPSREVRTDVQRLTPGTN